MDKQQAERETLAKLASHPGWQILRDYAEQRRVREFQAIANGLMLSATPVDQRRVDAKREFWRGVTWILKHPTVVLKELTSDEEEGDPA